MTAEIAVLNKSAIALAADSAVTLGGDQGKIYNTVNKLFTLSKRQPVGIMVYANADFMGVPFETIIKMYRNAARTPEKTIKSYAEKFVAFLSSATFSSGSQQSSNVRRIWEAVFESMAEDIRKAIEFEFREEGDCTTARQKQIISKIFAAHLEELKKCEVSDGLKNLDASDIVDQYSKEFDFAKKTVFGDMATAKSTDQRLREIAGLAITKEHPFPTYSGIVIAGFGEDEIFPQYIAITSEGVVAGAHKYQTIDEDGISHDGAHSMIVPFAQKEMVGRFMEGVDPAYRYYIEGAMGRALRDCAKGVIEAYVGGSDGEKKRIREQVNKSIEKQLEEFQKHATNYRRKKFVDPVLEVLVGLPKEELANLAEALVNLTSIKRRVSAERETVGGPIDVAVISKGDGFIWIRRKHYFKLELNPHFVPGYLDSKEETNGSA